MDTPVPPYPTRGVRDTDEQWLQKRASWSAARDQAYQAWDDLKIEREADVQRFIDFYGGQVLNLIDGQTAGVAVLPDSFNIRVELSGRGLRDLVLNVPYIFEVLEPDDIALPQLTTGAGADLREHLHVREPDEGAPTVCVIDSGVQEEHRLLSSAIDRESSRSLVPEEEGDISDRVPPGGHGTRVAGAILYGEHIPTAGDVQLPFWIQNARVLDGDCSMHSKLFPPLALRSIVEQNHRGYRRTRLFNHSINARGPCRTHRMSAWAAELDDLSNRHDVLVIQSAGNIPCSNPAPHLGVGEHLSSGHEYPGYLAAPSSRIANPAQSLQALTVGSIAYGEFNGGAWSSVAEEQFRASAFSRTGLGLWGVIKPEVVEFGGDYMRTTADVPEIGTPDHLPDAYPELVRTTMYPPGPSVDRDSVGTSFSAPKVARIAASIESVLPDETCLLYRALVVHSARWPQWAADCEDPLSVLRRIGFGVPDILRATENTNHRVTLVISKDPNDLDRDLTIAAGDGHVYQIPIPEQMRRPGDDFDVLVEVTLSYVSTPRRTRRGHRGYLATWADWTSSMLEESVESFESRALKEPEETAGEGRGVRIPWMLGMQERHGTLKGARRNIGTVQKDWAVVKSNQLPESFCVAVRGHKGWSLDPDSNARYALAVSFEMVGQEVPIYDSVRAAVQGLRVDIQAEQAPDVEVPLD